MPSVSKFADLSAKLRKNESNAKEKTVFYVALLSDSNFGVAKVTKKPSAIQNKLFVFC